MENKITTMPGIKQLVVGERIRIKWDTTRYIKDAIGRTGTLELIGSRYVIRFDIPIQRSDGWSPIEVLTVTDEDVYKIHPNDFKPKDEE